MGTLSLGVLLQGKGAEGVGTRVKYVPWTVWQGEQAAGNWEVGCLGKCVQGNNCPGIERKEKVRGVHRRAKGHTSKRWYCGNGVHDSL